MCVAVVPHNLDLLALDPVGIEHTLNSNEGVFGGHGTRVGNTVAPKQTNVE